MQGRVVECSLRLMGEKLCKSEVFLYGINGSLRVARKWKISKSQMKAVLITSFDIKVIVHFKFISQGEAANQACYLEIVMGFHETVHR
jgi:hypothetical protein